MSEDASIRRANLSMICRNRGWSAAQLRDELDWGRYTYWRDLMADPKKSFGEKVARRIEDKLGLGRGWLDEDHDGRGRPQQVREASAGREASRGRLPFTAELVAALHRCDPATLRKMENTLRLALDLPQLPAKVSRKRA